MTHTKDKLNNVEIKDGYRYALLTNSIDAPDLYGVILTDNNENVKSIYRTYKTEKESVRNLILVAAHKVIRIKFKCEHDSTIFLNKFIQCDLNCKRKLLNQYIDYVEEMYEVAIN